jgi:hypothetical protein
LLIHCSDEGGGHYADCIIEGDVIFAKLTACDPRAVDGLMAEMLQG